MVKDCSIRLLKQEELMVIFSWRNHPKIRTYMLNQHEISLDEHQEWYKSASVDKTRKLLLVLEKKTPFGFVQLVNITDTGDAEWGFYTSPNAPKGSGIKLGLVALEYFFLELGLQKIHAQVIVKNHASLRFHKKLGFQQEGIIKHQKSSDDYELICFVLTRSNWQSMLLIQEINHASN